MQRADQGEASAHLTQAARVPVDGRAHVLFFEVVQYLMPVINRRCRLQRGQEIRREVVFIPAGRHRLHDLIKIQVSKKLRCFPGARMHIWARMLTWLLEQYALKGHTSPAPTGLSPGRSHQPRRRFRRASSPAFILPWPLPR